MLPSILSEGSLIINQEQSSFITLEELITLRNKILHNKDSLKVTELPIKSEVVDGQIILPYVGENLELNIKLCTSHIDSLSQELCIRFGEAMGDFKK